jgi:CrcB protein
VTSTTALLIALGAALGAPLRYAVERLTASAWPWGTWAVNVVGSAILGALVGKLLADGGIGSAPSLLALVGTGFCGALTTFGGFAAQVLDLAAAPADVPRGSRALRSSGYALVSVGACVGIAAATYALTTAILSR